MDLLSTYSPLLDLISAVAAATIALIAYLYTRKAARLNFIMQTTSMLNDINAEFLASDANLQALSSLRATPSEDARRDYLMLNNLNYLHAIWSLREERAIKPMLANAKLENGAGFWVSAPEDYLKTMLTRGYPPAFQSEIKSLVKRLSQDASDPGKD